MRLTLEGEVLAGYQFHKWNLKQCDQSMPILKDWEDKGGENRSRLGRSG